MNTAVIKSAWVGQVVDGRFLLLEWLGGTEYGSIFRTELQGPQPRRAAIRLLQADAENPNAQGDHCASLASLSHPHLMRIFRTGRCRVDGLDLLYVVTEFAEESLAQVLPERPLTSAETREMLMPVLDALSYVHGQGRVYGHLKPSNVMVVDDQVKLPLDSLCYAAGFRNQPAIYDAPETAAEVLSPAADIWSLGVMLVEVLTQHPPRWDRSQGTDAEAPQLPSPFAEIARGCLRYDAARRLTVEEIRARLDPQYRAAPSAAPPAAPTARPQTRHPEPVAVGAPAKQRPSAPQAKRGPALIIAVGLALLVIVAFLFMHSRKTLPPPAQVPTTASAPAPLPGPPAAPPSGAATKGEVAERVMPDVTASANHTIRGRVEVTVRVNVDPSGAVSNAAFDTRGSSRYFSDRALEAAQHWKFKPAQINGQPVASVWTLQFEFRSTGPEITAAEVSP